MARASRVWSRAPRLTEVCACAAVAQIFGDDDGEEVKVPHWDGESGNISESEYIKSVSVRCWALQRAVCVGGEGLGDRKAVRVTRRCCAFVPPVVLRG